MCLYGLWAATIVALYYVRPENASIFDGPVWPLTHWQTATAEVIRSIAGAILVLLAARGAALFVPQSAIPSRTHAEREAFLLAIGLMGLSALFQAAAYAGLYTDIFIRTTVIALAAVALLRFRQWWPAGSVPRLAGHEWVFVAIGALALAIAFVGALAPEVEYDALWYHLWLPQQWLAAGRPVDIVEEYVSLYPLAWDLLYGAASSLAGAGAAKLLHFACLPLLAVTTWLLSRELAPSASPLLAAVLTITTPTVMWEATTAYVDLALAWYVTLTVLAFVRYHHTGDRRLLLLAAVVLGGALSIKHLALVVFAILGVMLLAREVRRRRPAVAIVQTCVVFGGIALLVAAPWYARAYALSGNPVFPDLYGVFGASPPERWSQSTEHALRRFKSRFGRDRTVANVVRLPWDVTLHGARYGGSVGPLFLILVPVAFARGARFRTRTVLTAGCAAYVMVWASPISSFQLRFLVPLIPLLSIFAAVGAERLAALAGGLRKGGGRGVWTLAGILLTLNLPGFTEWHDRDRYQGGLFLTHVMRRVPLGVVVGAEPRDRYIGRRVASYNAWQFINTHLPVSAYVLTFSGGDHLYGMRRRLWSDATLAAPGVWQRLPGEEDFVGAWLAEKGITHLLVEQRLLEADEDTLALTSQRMRACCLVELYADRHFALFEIKAHDPRAGAGTGPARPDEYR